jgi:aconitate hydratase
VPGTNFDLGHGDVAIAAITSCTNTSNPYVMVAAGMLARNAVKRGLQVKPWVKTSLAPGSQVVTDYLEKAGLQHDLDTLGFNLVGYGCTTCIGNSGPLPEEISKTIQDHGLAVASVLSGNRNFEGRVNHDVRANYLASPPLVVAYALAGSVMVDLTTEPLGTDAAGEAVYLKDIWPSSKAVAKTVRKAVKKSMFRNRYGNVFEGDKEWQGIEVTGGLTYEWDVKSTYVQEPPYFVDLAPTPKPVTDIVDARILGLFLDSITTDHISPAGAIKRDSPAGRYLTEHGVAPHDFNSYGSRRGNHEVMMRGTFANTRIKNQILKGIEGGVTLHYPSVEGMSIYDAAMRYGKEGVPTVIFAGKEYGTGSSRDWAAKGPRLLGVRAVIAESFERIHRSNLIGMGILPLVFAEGMSWQSLELKGPETVTLQGLSDIKPGQWIEADITYGDGTKRAVPLRARIDTFDELDYFRNGGILHYVLRGLAREAA